MRRGTASPEFAVLEAGAPSHSAKDILMFPCRVVSSAALAGLLTAAPLWAQSDSHALKINQIQVIGTHNSYHAGIAPSEARLWRQKDPRGFQGLDYRHRPLAAQFDAGVRQIGRASCRERVWNCV